jgi:Domain of unknown function (DUF4412)
MKKIIFLTIVLFVSILSRADFVIQLRGIGMGATNNVSLSIRGNMLREDDAGNPIGHIVQITDMTNLDTTVLMPKTKTFTRTHTTKKAGETSSDMNTKPQPASTGKTEKVGDFETEIYLWTNGKNVTNKLWVAKNYPNFDDIKPYLIKIDDFENRGPGRDLEPSVARLPGMVIKREENIESQKIVVDLISVKVQPVEASLFEIPNDYKEHKY